MRKPDFVTFTGTDQQTSLVEMALISKQYPVEWGVLMSESQQGISNRFPAYGRVREAAWAASDFRLSAHLCGKLCRDIMLGKEIDTPPLTRFSRIQVNHTRPIPHMLKKFAEPRGKPVIAQFVYGPFPRDDSVQWLYDPSGGIGHKPREWPRHPGDGRLVGYAGGIGPDNVLQVLEEINSDGPYWIDMETKVRTDDWFDLEKCRSVLTQIYGAR